MKPPTAPGLVNDGRIGRRVHAFTDDALGDLDAVALAELVASGDRSSAELVEAALARAAQVDDDLNAVSVWDGDRARSLAATAPARSTDGADVFAGVPTFVKAVSAYEGLPNRMGSRAIPDTPAPESAPEVDHLLSTGLIPLGLSTTPEFGLVATTEPALTGATRNPWSLDHSTGGSSGGAAALVAAGVVPVAHANDGGGSIRIPASCCGLVGLKPSRGRIDATPIPKLFPVDPSINGVVTRTVRDTVEFMRGAERFRPGPGLRPIGDVTPSGRRLRIGVVDERPDRTHLDSRNSAELLRVAASLEALGHQVELIPSPFPARLADDFLLFWAMFPMLLWRGGKRIVGPDFDREQLEPFTKWLARDAQRRIASAPGAFRRIRRFVDEYHGAYRDHDVLLSTTLGGPVHRLGFFATDLPGEVVTDRARQQVPMTWIHNAGGGPAISLPLATDTHGLPMGMHFAADVGEEAMLLELALELEQAHPWPTLAAS